MKRALLDSIATIAPIAPIALLTTGCDMRAYTPSELVPTSLPEPSKVVQMPARDEAIARWQLPPNNAWAPYEKLTLLTALESTSMVATLPDVEENETVRAAQRAAYEVAISGLPRDAMWIVDLRGAASVAFASTMTRVAQEPISPVPTFNNWPAEDEMVPAEETLAAMVTMLPRLPPEDQTSIPMFLLDAWRLAYKDETVDEGTTDNRYMLLPTDFPTAEALRTRGITRIVYVVESLGESVHEEDDLNALFLAYQDAGIQVSLVDLAWLAGPPPEGVRVWHEQLWTHVYVCDRRFTVVDDPRFYVRARGGFGGVHGVSGGGYVHAGRGYGGGGWHGGG